MGAFRLQRWKRMLQLSGCYRGSESDLESEESENDEVLVSEGEGQEEADESAFGKLIASAVEQSQCMPVASRVIIICHARKETSEEAQF